MPDIFEFRDKNIKKSAVKGKFSNSWLENSYEVSRNDSFDTRANKPNNESFMGTGIKKKKIKGLIIFLIIAFIVILCRIIFLQIINGDHYRELAEGNRIRLKPISSERGVVFDRYGKQLV